MHVKKLSSISFEEILDCFLLAFESYYVKMPTDKDYYQKRWKAAKVDFNLSYGMFDNKKLVGFIIHAIDKRNGVSIAFNSGTGVIPQYRGRKIVKSIYEHALKELKEIGIEKTTLEVITKNDIAVHLYQSIGFNIAKRYKCFGGVLQIDSNQQFELKEIDLLDIHWKKLPNQELYSWDNQKESIIGGNYKFFHVIYQNQPESFFIINPDQNYLAQFDLLSMDQNSWNRLFLAIKSISDTVKINNVDERLKEKVDYLNHIGLQNTVDQFEMELNIKNNSIA